ncbi:pyridoxal phosphate-dependent aminotransferase [Bacillus sp. HMF5848]|uniref:MalY/PatB family protein n=1 Tax=Bacillus sp. HMF5848 TaxID=2495421 RepID=UPI000F78C550|nr:MalY/PatB family protein [Bacillus sp. HMF5848]RSK28403.1 pyridoxal phosphate-dependent aminotransferase [Bacillus sp. HMF5848]
MTRSFNDFIERKGTKSLKWDETKKVFGKSDVLPLWVADMDFSAPDEVVQAIQARSKHPIFGYTIASDETKQAVVNWLQSRHNWSIKNEWVTFTSGVVPALAACVQTFTNENDSILIFTPVYHPFFQVIQKNNRKLITSSLLIENNHYEIDFNDVEQKFANGIKAIIFCSPHNPGGRVWTKSELQTLAALCKKYNVLIISDDIHSDLLLNNHKHIPISHISEDSLQRTITCIAPSKTFNLAGLQASATIIANKDLRKAYEDHLHKQGHFTLNTFAIEGIEASYRYGAKWLNEVIAYIEENVQLVQQVLPTIDPRIRIMKPEATYLIWLDFRGLGIEEKTLQYHLLTDGKVALEPGSRFGEDGSGFFRLNVACPRSTLTEGLERIKLAVEVAVKNL